jgi:hypothetical protein
MEKKEEDCLCSTLKIILSGPRNGVWRLSALLSATPILPEDLLEELQNGWILPEGVRAVN